MQRRIFEEEHEALRAMARAFAENYVAPQLAGWADAGQVDRALYQEAGKLGLLGFDVEEEYGGGGVRDVRYSVVLNEELTRVGATAVTMNLCGFNDLVAPYLSQLASSEQKARWLPDLCAGRAVAAIAMTEPGAGSDLKAITTTAVRDGHDYVLDGAKTFISNGILADVVIVAAKTDVTAGSRGLSLLVVERGMPGFERGRRLEKVGLAAQDTAELFFDDVRVPRANLLGREGAGFEQLRHNLVRERLCASVTAVSSMARALDLTRAHVRDRRAFGQRIADFQATKFSLAEVATEVEVAQAFVDRCIQDFVEDRLSEVEAAMCKWWVTERQQRVVSRCLQLHGGYGYLREYPIAREFLDARVGTLYAGTTEIMKEIIGRSLVGTP